MIKKNYGHIVHVAACFRLVSGLKREQQQEKKRVTDGYGRSFGSWPWQKKNENV